ncbi:MAG: YceD family protein [Bacillota bacterium]
MKINILRIRNAPGEKLSFDLSKPFNGIGANGQRFTFTTPVEATGEVVNRNDLFQVKGVTRATVSTNCVNCLEPFELKLQGFLEEGYTRLDDELIKDPDSELVGFDGDFIDIEPEVIKSLLMELPMRLVCAPDCRGLCQRCGSNLNVQWCNCQKDDIDPRLAVLKKLQQ